MKAEVDKNKCVWCGSCADVCPADAIKLDDDAAFVTDECIGCGSCVEVCVAKAITLK
ncbi:MAG: 4Fe-4S binding protein [Eubacteriaceae bacterium]